MARGEEFDQIEFETARGQWSQGDAARLPDGYARKVRNFLLNAGTWEKRPQFTFDDVASVVGLFSWEDESVQATRLCAVNSGGSVFVKAASGEAWGGALSGTTGGSRLTSADSYKGRVFGMLDDGAGLPSAAFVYDGSTVSSSPFNSVIAARSIVFYKQRAFLIYPRVTVTNLLSVGQAYSAVLSYWNLANVDARNVVNGSATVGEIIPTDTATAYIYTSAGTVSALADPAYRVWLCDLRNPHPTYDMPVTLSIQLSAPWEFGAAYLENELVTPSASNGFRYRAANAGTSDGGTEPTWPTTIGLTVNDNGITWLCEGPDTLGSLETEVANASDAPNFTRQWIEARLPPTPASYTVRIRIAFGNTASPTFTKSALHIGFRDGRADGNPAKSNHGQQVTAGDFFYPFFNVETSTPPVVDLDEIVWSEIGEPERIRAENTYNMRGSSGLPTGGALLAGRLVIFKRRSIWKFVATDDPDNPIVPEGDEIQAVGCIGPLAYDVHEDVAYFIGEHSVYAWSYGSDPVDICGEGMRGEIMNRTKPVDADVSSWVEEQTYNMPICHVDKRNHVVWVYTQRGRLFLYFIRFKAWASIDVGGGTGLSPVGYEIRSIRYHAATGNMYVAFATAGSGTAGLARMDASVAPALDQISTNGTLTVDSELWLRPVELTGPRYEILLDSVTLYHRATDGQSGQTTTAYVSLDQGVSFQKYNQVQLAPVSEGGYDPLRLDLYQSWGTLMLRVLHSGNGGAASFAISRIEADVQTLSGHYLKSQPIAQTVDL